MVYSLHMSEQKQNGISTGTGLVIAGILIAAAIIFSGSFAGEQKVANEGGGQDLGDLVEVTKEDHVYGDPKAEITFIEYSDFECPFCARFHPTMEQIVADNPDVKWVYRHFPISSHRNARPAALASECIADLGGNEMFWEFSGFVFESIGSLSNSLYIDFAIENGVDESEFRSCLESEKFAEKVDGDFVKGQLSGVSGTPSSFVVTPDGETVPFSGALPIENIQALLDQIKNS